MPPRNRRASANADLKRGRLADGLSGVTSPLPPSPAPPVLAAARPLWRRKKTYLALLAILGVVHGGLYTYGLAHPPTQLGIQLFIVFTLNVALLGWCYVDAEERMVAITGRLGFCMLFVSWLGVPWYFIRSRGFLRAGKAGFGLGFFALWVVTLVLGCVLATIAGLGR